MEDLHERVARLLLLVEDGSIECDEMVLGGQLESAHAIGGFARHSSSASVSISKMPFALSGSCCRHQPKADSVSVPNWL